MTAQRFSIEGYIALVTGASSGIGAHFCKILAAEGAQVVACARRMDKLNSLVTEVKADGGKIMAVAMDVNDPGSVKSAFDSAEAQLGCPDVVCNNAGIAIVKPFLELEEGDWDAVLNTDLKAVYTVAREAGKRMVAAEKGGNIINTASILGFGTSPGQAAYATAKGGVVQLTRSIGMDLGRYGIRCNAIAPGYFKTEINTAFFESEAGLKYIKGTPARRLGSLEELDGALLLLASNASSFMNGSVITVDGAHSVRLV